MPFEIKTPAMPKKTFIINRNLHLDKDGKVVEEGDSAGRKVLGGKGKAFYEEEAAKYGLNESHRLVEEKPKVLSQSEAREALGFKPEPSPIVEPAVAPALGTPSAIVLEPLPVVEPEPIEAEELKGKLPPDFPGHAALAEAGINTYGQLAKVEDVTTIPGIGEATAAKIAEALKG